MGCDGWTKHHKFNHETNTIPKNIDVDLLGLLEMDFVERTVRCDGKLVDLLPREFTLLEYFMRRPGQIVTRAMLLEDVWNFKFMAQTNVVDVQIGNLRRKLDPTGARRFIANIRAVGFKLNVDD